MKINYPIIILLLTFFNAIHLSSQVNDTRIIKGVVFDPTDGPLIGATVQVNNTAIGVITDIEGTFELDIPKNKNVELIVSYGHPSVTLKTRKNKSFYRINVQKHLNEHAINFSTNRTHIINSASVDRNNFSCSISYLFSKPIRYKFELLTGLHFDYQFLKNEDEKINTLELPVQLQYGTWFPLKLFGGVSIGHLFTVNGEDTILNDRYFMGETIGVNYELNYRIKLKAQVRHARFEIENKKSHTWNYGLVMGYRFK